MIDGSQPGPRHAARQHPPGADKPVLDYPARVPVSRLARFLDAAPLLIAAIPGVLLVSSGLYWTVRAATVGPAWDRANDELEGGVITAIGVIMVLACTPWFWRAVRYLRRKDDR